MLTGMEVKVTGVTEVSQSFDDVTRYCLQCLRWMAVFPFKGKDFAYLPTNVLPVYIFLTIMTTAAMNIMSAYNYILLGKFNVEAVYIAVVLIFAALRYALLVNWRVDYRKLVNECRAIWSICSASEHLILLQYDKKVKIFLWLLVVCGIVSLMTFVTVSIISCILAARTNNTEIKQLPFKWFVEDVYDSPDFEIAFITQFVLFGKAAIMLSLLESAAPFVIIYNAGYYNTLHNRLLMISYEKYKQTSHNTIYKHILDCVKFHQRILNLSANIEKLTKVLFFLQFLGTGYVLALVGLHLLGSDPDKYKSIPILGFGSMQFLIYQCAPEFLMQNSEAVSTAAYYAYSPSMTIGTQKALSFLLARAQRPVELTAGGIMQLSLKTFASIISSTISFCLVLTRVAGET